MMDSFILEFSLENKVRQILPQKSTSSVPLIVSLPPSFPKITNTLSIKERVNIRSGREDGKGGSQDLST